VALFGPNWTEDRRWQTFFCGIDLKPFEMFPDRISLRRSLGIPPEALVVGHVGRFIKPKNHKKIISVFRNVLSKETGAYLLLVGDGPLRASVEKRIRSLGLTERVVLTGLRVDALELMRNVMDVFLFPSIHEGLGLALVEAQAAGLPCIISDAIPMDADVIREQVTRLSLSESDTVWQQSLLSAAAIGRSPPNPRLFSRFDIAKSIKSWETIYANAADWRL
jgi:glycosyltransferase involved in cell wall biosynthesis